MWKSLKNVIKGTATVASTNIGTLNNVSKVGENESKEMLLRSEYRLSALEDNKDTIKAVEKLKYESELSTEIQEAVKEANGISLEDAMKMLK